jgi:tRNA threonylcarbamoyladenosine biosynthesis protein TsaB
LGLAFAKTLCFAAQIPVVGVHSLEVLAHQSTPMEDGQSRKVLAVLDARRKQFFAAGYLVDRTAQREQIAPRLVNEAWLAQMAERGWALVGPVIGQFMQSGFLAKITDTSAVPAIHSQALPSAGSLAEIATQRLADGQLDDLWTLKPLYLRPSAAEEKLPPLDPFKVSP